MAIKIGGGIVKSIKPKKSHKDIWLGKTVWFLYNLDGYQGNVVSKVDDEHYLVDATCCNIHKQGEKQQSIQPTSKLTLVDDDF